MGWKKLLLSSGRSAGEGMDFQFKRVSPTLGGAAPIRTGTGEVMVTLTGAGPSFRLNKREVPPLGKLVMQYAPKIGSFLGGTSDSRGVRGASSISEI
jgi:hypothetical protein